MELPSLAAGVGLCRKERRRSAVNTNEAFLILEWFLPVFNVSLFSNTTLYIKHMFLHKHGLPLLKQNA